MRYEDLPSEEKAKLEEFKSAEELMEYVGSEGIELTDDQLDLVSGGYFWEDDPKPYVYKQYCPYCHGTSTATYKHYGPNNESFKYCHDCGRRWPIE